MEECSFDRLLSAANASGGVQNQQRLFAAYEFARRAHEGQSRKSGEPYFMHPFEVAMILTEYKADEDSLVTALLHDTVEDCDIGCDEIETAFGPAVMKMVNALTKLPRVRSTEGVDGVDVAEYRRATIESLRKLLDTMRDDARVVVIKLVDRLHNIRSLWAFREEKQQRIAQETMDTYVPIADRLGMYDMKEQLADISFRYLYPQRYADIQAELSQPPLGEVSEDIAQKLSVSSIGRKIVDLHFQEYINYEALIKSTGGAFHRTILVMMVVGSEEECYLALHAIHSFWQREKGSFRDHINTPRENGFRGIVTHVLRDDDIRLRFVVQTSSLYQQGRLGVATECFSDGKPYRMGFQWMESLRMVSEDTQEKSEAFRAHLDKDILADQILVHGPKGKVMRLPPKCTALDAAFYCSDEDAFRVRVPLLNDRQVSYSEYLKEGDSVSFALQDTPIFDPAWIDYVDTGYAKAIILRKIRSFPKGDKMLLGRELLQKTMTLRTMGFVDEVDRRAKAEAVERLGESTWDEVLVRMAEGKLDPNEVADRLFRNKDHGGDSSYTLEILRPASAFATVAKTAEQMEEEGVHPVHVKTVRFGEGYRDVFRIRCDSAKAEHLLARFSSEFPMVSVREFYRYKTFLAAIAIILLILAWAADPPLTKYVYSFGMSPLLLSFIRLMSGSITLFLILFWRRLFLFERFERLPFPWFFWGIMILLSVSEYLANFSLQTISGTSFITIFAILHISLLLWPTFLLAQVKNVHSSLQYLLVPLVCSLSAMLFLFLGFPTSLLLIGHAVGLTAMMAHLVYLNFHQRYQALENVQGRGLWLLAYMFLFGSLLYLPFLAAEESWTLPVLPYALATLEGITTFGVASFLYFWVSRYVGKPLFLGLLSITALLVLASDWMFYTLDTVSFTALGFILVALFYSLWYARAVQQKDLRLEPRDAHAALSFQPVR